MSAYYEQPLRKLLGSLSQTIGWLSEKGTVEVNTVPTEHLEAVKQLEKIGIVHKRNNKIYELQKVRLKKLMDNMGMDSLPEPQPVPVASIQPIVQPAMATLQPAVTAVEKPVVATAVVVGDPGSIN